MPAGFSSAACFLVDGIPFSDRRACAWHYSPPADKLGLREDTNAISAARQASFCRTRSGPLARRGNSARVASTVRLCGLYAALLAVFS
ncbi:hypothetical protein OH77DRAFT_139160 [Trametes cingulata]|nr:hypothetical protein OH77DRAFT_139160 [Trametes cingulata]